MFIGPHALGCGRVLCVLSAIIVLALTSSPGYAATLPAGFSESLVASNITNPTAMGFAPDGRLFVCQQNGSLRVIKNGTLLATPFVQITVDSSGERGLLGVAFDPNFNTNHFVYVYYTSPVSPVHNRVSRFTANGDVAVAGSEQPIFDLNNLGATNHNGGALHFGPDGKLYVAVGENATGSNSQTLSNLLGKTLRINSDGSIPTDNPFFNQATGNNRAIYALGLRNPYTFDFQPGTGVLFINDVGDGAFEEINLGQAGANYGWPTCEGPCSNPNFTNPIYAYPHNGSPMACAIVGGAFYNPASNQFPATYTGRYFFADLCGGFIKTLNPAQGNAVNDFATGLVTPVDLKVSADGSLYYLVRGGGGQVYRIQYTASQVSFSQATFAASEGAGSASVNVSRSGDLSAPATVDYATSNGTANETSDYTTNVGTLSFAPGESSKTVTILLTDDVYVEGAETVNLTLSNPVGASLGSQSTSLLTISDNDSSAPTTNPADNANFFVRQNYLDFLNREADSGGLAFWSAQITGCGSDAQCIHNKRIDVSAAFFVEQEFQDTGFFIIRLYRSSFGRLPTFLEFSRDRSDLAAGANLDAEKAALTLDFVQRSEFTTKFPITQNNTAFVDALIAAVNSTSGVNLTSKRTELLNEYALGTNQSDSRARVLRKLIEYQEYRDAEFNGAFVLAQYFGYLRRDPDTGGYQFWLDVLNNRVPGNFRSMVCAFITSDEFQQRFSPVVTRHNSDCGP
jgi:glucose/arabinose dehydrogenase